MNCFKSSKTQFDTIRTIKIPIPDKWRNIYDFTSQNPENNAKILEAGINTFMSDTSNNDVIKQLEHRLKNVKIQLAKTNDEYKNKINELNLKIEILQHDNNSEKIRNANLQGQIDRMNTINNTQLIEMDSLRIDLQRANNILLDSRFNSFDDKINKLKDELEKDMLDNNKNTDSFKLNLNQLDNYLLRCNFSIKQIDSNLYELKENSENNISILLGINLQMTVFKDYLKNNSTFIGGILISDEFDNYYKITNVNLDIPIIYYKSDNLLNTNLINTIEIIKYWFNSSKYKDFHNNNYFNKYNSDLINIENNLNTIISTISNINKNNTNEIFNPISKPKIAWVSESIDEIVNIDLSNNEIIIDLSENIVDIDISENIIQTINIPIPTQNDNINTEQIKINPIPKPKRAYNSTSRKKNKHINQ